MGLGLLFAGYITLLSFKVFPPVMLIGAYLMYRALKKLQIYGESFAKAKSSAFALAVYFGAYTAVWIADAALFKGKICDNVIFTLCDSILYYTLLAIFNILLTKAVGEICELCGYDKGMKRIAFSKVLMTAFFVAAAISLVFYSMNINTYLSLAAVLCEIVWLMYTSFFLYGCYMRIATEGIISEEEKEAAERTAKKAIKNNQNKGR